MEGFLGGTCNRSELADELARLKGITKGEALGLVYFLLKQKNNTNMKEKTGWLSPDGCFVECQYGDHEEKASDISKEIKGFIFGNNVIPQYSATFSKTIELYKYLKIQKNILYVPDCNGWDNELFVTKKQYSWLINNINLTETIPLRVVG